MHQLTYHIHKHAQHTLTISQHSHWHTHWFAACTLWLFLSHMNTYTQMHSLSLSLFHAHTYTHTHTHTVTQHHACQRVIACLHDLELWTLLIPMVGCIADVLFSYCNEFAFASISWWQFLGEVIKGSRYYKDTWSSHSLGVRLATEKLWLTRTGPRSKYIHAALYIYASLFSPCRTPSAHIQTHAQWWHTCIYYNAHAHTHACTCIMYIHVWTSSRYASVYSATSPGINSDHASASCTSTSVSQQYSNVWRRCGYMYTYEEQDRQKGMSQVYKTNNGVVQSHWVLTKWNVSRIVYNSCKHAFRRANTSQK